MLAVHKETMESLHMASTQWATAAVGCCFDSTSRAEVHYREVHEKYSTAPFMKGNTDILACDADSVMHSIT
jgi:hypothetical protein